MRLSSVQALKAQLLEELRDHLRRKKVAKRFLVEIGAEGPSTPIQRPSLAFGIAPGRSGYSLAIRLFDKAQETRQLAELARARAVSEAQVAYVGHVRAPGRNRRAGRFQKRIRPIAPGYSIAHKDSTAGTIGAFATRGDYVCVLSNNHVLADTNQGSRYDALLQPGPHDGGRPSRDQIGWLGGFKKLKSSRNLVDAAIGFIADDVDYDVTYKGQLLAGVRDDVELQDTVWKIGRTTGVTIGRVSALSMDNVEVDYSDEGDGTLVCSFDNQIEIRGTKSRPLFSEGGDSGSLILDTDCCAVGLLFSGSDETGTTYANPIRAVLDSFDLELIAG